jgi:hypothetical protein
MKDTKELLELIKGLKEIGLLVKLALKDGKIDMTDLGLLSALLVKQQTFVDAFVGLSELPGEVKDLSLDEALGVITALIEAAKEVKAA